MLDDVFVWLCVDARRTVGCQSLSAVEVESGRGMGEEVKIRRLTDENAAVGAHHLSDVGEDLDGVVVEPIVSVSENS